MNIPNVVSNKFLVKRGDKIYFDDGHNIPSIRNQCWKCEKIWSTTRPLPKEEGQKEYFYCNHCGQINHI